MNAVFMIETNNDDDAHYLNLTNNNDKKKTCDRLCWLFEFVPTERVIPFKPRLAGTGM